MDAPCNLQESIHVLVTKYLFVSSFWGTHHSFGSLFFVRQMAAKAWIKMRMLLSREKAAASKDR